MRWNGKTGFDDYQTDPDALSILVPYIPQGSVVWECAVGEGGLAAGLTRSGLTVVASDIKAGQDFLTWEPDVSWDCIVTNPPFSLKNEFLSRCYQLGRPFALLLPLSGLESKARQKHFRRYGVQLIIPDRRVEYHPPGNLAAQGASFLGVWFTWGLLLPRDIMFESVTPLGQLTLELTGVGEDPNSGLHRESEGAR